jgi:hypothetical protein
MTCIEKAAKFGLAAPIAVMHESAAMNGPPFAQRVLQCIKDVARLRRRLARHPTIHFVRTTVKILAYLEAL